MWPSHKTSLADPLRIPSSAMSCNVETSRLSSKRDIEACDPIPSRYLRSMPYFLWLLVYMRERQHSEAASTAHLLSATTGVEQNAQELDARSRLRTRDSGTSRCSQKPSPAKSLGPGR